ncbi:MAG: OmpH family outer membrane protein [Planctomycetota bacterium]|nr:OmpH family outer membrane protein [Planctomycetota bacterium]
MTDHQHRYHIVPKLFGLALCGAVLTLVLQASLSAVGVQLESHRVGVCDVQVVLDQIPQGKQITVEFNQLKVSMEQEIRDRETTLRQIQQEAEQLLPGTDGRREVEKRFTLAKAELAWMQEDLEREFTTRFKERRDGLIKLVRAAIEEVAGERELDLVLNNVARASDFKVYVSVWAKPELDITVDVISRVSAKDGDN